MGSANATAYHPACIVGFNMPPPLTAQSLPQGALKHVLLLASMAAVWPATTWVPLLLMSAAGGLGRTLNCAAASEKVSEACVKLSVTLQGIGAVRLRVSMVKPPPLPLVQVTLSPVPPYTSTHDAPLKQVSVQVELQLPAPKPQTLPVLDTSMLRGAWRRGLGEPGHMACLGGGCQSRHAAAHTDRGAAVGPVTLAKGRACKRRGIRRPRGASAEHLCPATMSPAGVSVICAEDEGSGATNAQVTS